MMRFAEALQQAGEQQVLEACRSLRLDRDEVSYVLARHRRTPYLLDLVLTLGDYIRMRLEVREASMVRW